MLSLFTSIISISTGYANLSKPNLYVLQLSVVLLPHGMVLILGCSYRSYARDVGGME